MIPATAPPCARSPLHGRRVSALELCALARVTMLAVAVEVAVRVLPLPVVARALRVSLTRPPACAGAATLPELSRAERRAVRMVRGLMRRWPWGQGTCLRRSLVVGHVLRRHDPWLRVGVARTAGDIGAHAWLEIRGVAVGGAGPFLAFEIP